MRTLLKYSTWIILAGLLSGCLDEVRLTPEGNFSDNVVINGKLTHHGDRATILVRTQELVPRGRFTGTRPVATERVTLLDVDGMERDIPISTENRGFYDEISSGDAFEIRPGKSYQLEVELEDGKVYRSAIEPLIKVPEIQGLSFEPRSSLGTTDNGEIFEQNLVVFQVATDPRGHNSQERSRLRWSVEGVFQLTQEPGVADSPVCYLEFASQPGDFSLFDGTVLAPAQDLLTIDVYGTAVNYRFAEGMQVEIYQESLSATAYSYWEQVKRVLNRSGTIAEDPVGEVRGNWSSVDNRDEVVYGLFYAVDRTSNEIFVRPEEAGNPAFYCPQPVPPAGVVTLCTDCREAWGPERSSFIPPTGWGG